MMDKSLTKADVKGIVHDEMSHFFEKTLKPFFDSFRSDMVSLKDEIVGELKTNSVHATV